MINSPGVKALIEKLPLLQAQNFLDDNGARVEHFEILTHIAGVLKDGRIDIGFLLPVPQEPLDELYYSLQDEARSLVDI